MVPKRWLEFNGTVYPVAFNPAGVGNGYIQIVNNQGVSNQSSGDTTPLYDWADTFSWSRGRHAFKFGVDYPPNRLQRIQQHRRKHSSKHHGRRFDRVGQQSRQHGECGHFQPVDRFSGERPLEQRLHVPRPPICCTS